MKQRSFWQKTKDFLTFPLRAIAVFYEDRWGLSALASERFDYVSSEVIGRCLDVGCGPYNRLIDEFLDGQGVGIDVFKYPGLRDDQVFNKLTHFPFPDESFSTVTFIANINHIPRSDRLTELTEAYRCLKKGGKLILTFGNPVTEILAHTAIRWYDKIFKTQHDVDETRGWGAEEDLYLFQGEILDLLRQAGFTEIKKKRFFTQWFMNRLFIGWKK